MNKPISKHALRRAMEKVSAEGLVQCAVPIGTVVNQLWHELEKASYIGARKRPDGRGAARAAPASDTPDVELP